MPAVDFQAIVEEADEKDDILVMRALVRRSLLHGLDNRPAILILTKDTLFVGSESSKGSFTRIPLRSIVESGRRGRLIWECVEVKHLDTEGEKRIYICPFQGHPSAPRKDRESMDSLIKRLRCSR